jgi:hypothetical protein
MRCTSGVGVHRRLGHRHRRHQAPAGLVEGSTETATVVFDRLAGVREGMAQTLTLGVPPVPRPHAAFDPCQRGMISICSQRSANVKRWPGWTHATAGLRVAGSGWRGKARAGRLRRVCGAGLPAGDRPAVAVRRQVVDVPKITGRSSSIGWCPAVAVAPPACCRPSPGSRSRCLRCYARAATHAPCNARLQRDLIAVVDHHRAHSAAARGAVPAGWVLTR